MKKHAYTLLVFAAMTTLFALHYRLPEGIINYAMAKLLGESTLFTKYYTDKKFRAIKIGNSKSVVKAIIGDPFHVRVLDDGSEVWHYSKGAEEAGFNVYRTRILIFTPEGFVVEKFAELDEK